MILLIGFAFLAGVVTILSPCILPILPVVLSGSVAGGKRRPFGIVAGFVISFTLFTLFLTTIVKATGVSADFLRLISVAVVFTFGLSLLLPGFQAFTEKLFVGLARFSPTGGQGFSGGLLLGLGLGLLWTPCVGPILASVISLALTGSVSLAAFAITLAFSLGTAIPMFIVIYTGRSVLGRLQPYSALIQKTFGVLMILTAAAIYLNLDRKFQTFVLNVFPNYGLGLTRFENNPFVKNQLELLRATPMPETQIGRPMNELTDSALPDYGVAPGLILGGQWFNTDPITLESLRGKVVLVDFWTYTCINCIRTLPYLKSWHEKYSEKGLVIIGVHTPEFEFEKNLANVQKAIADFGLKYSVMQDNDYSTWNSYRNRYWPAKYLIDKTGHIRYTHFGEGEYDATESVIQQLLSLDMPIVNPSYQITAKTPELYLGSARRVPGYFTTTGVWDYSDEFAHPTAGATLTLDFESKDVFLVMRPQENLPGRVKIYLDDQELDTISVDSDKLYDLVRLPGPGRHDLRLEFLDSNLELYAFTFG